MPDAAVASIKSHTALESRLYNNVLAAKREFDIAAEARTKLVGKILKEDPESVAARKEAFDNEQRSLNHYVQALREYDNFLSDGKVPNEDGI